MKNNKIFEKKINFVKFEYSGATRYKIFILKNIALELVAFVIDLKVAVF